MQVFTQVAGGKLGGEGEGIMGLGELADLWVGRVAGPEE